MINNPTFLLIDDIQDNIAILKALLSRNFEDAIIVHATRGELGIELAKSTTPDIVFLDILMPGKDGFETCKELKDDPQLASVPVVFVTALKEAKKTKLKAISVGAEGFLTKPIDESSLITVTRAMLKVREAEIHKENEKERLRLLVKEKTHKIERQLIEKEQIEKELLNSEDRYKGLVDNLDSGVIIHLPSTKIIECNKKASEILGLTVDDLMTRNAKDPYWDFVDESENRLEYDKYPVNMVINSLEPLKNYLMGFKSKKFLRTKWLQISGHPRFNNDMELEEIVISFIDVTDRMEYEKRLKFAANNDHLTGLYNRRYYENKLIDFNREDNTPITIAMADINGLKLINDAFGHVYGDEMLQQTAKVIEEAIDDNDIVARIGGDEFGIIMPNTTKSQAEQKVRSIHHMASKITIQSIELSISVGYHTKLNKGEDLFEISRTAEDIMYRQKLIEIPSMRSNAIETILSTLYEKDRYSEYHSRRVSKMAARLGRAAGLTSQEIKEIETAGLVHDIGKIIIPSSIINKEGPLTKEEREIINTHPEIGFRILNSSSQLREISKIVLNHHERYDGTGYPRNIKGEDIPVQSRIISIVDAFEAMTSHRPYRSKYSEDKAINELKANSGTQFDSTLVEVFIKNFDEITEDVI